MIWSPSTMLPFGVDGEAAVGVAVVGDAHVGAALARTARPGSSRWVEPTPSLMFRPSGSAPITVTRAPASREHLGRDAGRRAVRAVEDDVDPVEAVRQRLPSRCTT